MKKTKIQLLVALFIVAVSCLANFAQEKADKSRYVEIFSGGKFFHSMNLIPPKSGRFSYSFSIYRVPEGEISQTAENQRIYAFQILPQVEGDMVKIEVLALLEDPNTVSEEHPLHNFKKQTVASYNLRKGESVSVTEMSQLGAKPLELKVTNQETRFFTPRRALTTPLPNKSPMKETVKCIF